MGENSGSGSGSGAGSGAGAGAGAGSPRVPSLLMSISKFISAS